MSRFLHSSCFFNSSDKLSPKTAPSSSALRRSARRRSAPRRSAPRRSAPRRLTSSMGLRRRHWLNCEIPTGPILNILTSRESGPTSSAADVQNGEIIAIDKKPARIALFMSPNPASSTLTSWDFQTRRPIPTATNTLHPGAILSVRTRGGSPEAECRKV